jgi:hypothetical protein
MLLGAHARRPLRLDEAMVAIRKAAQAIRFASNDRDYLDACATHLLDSLLKRAFN